MERSFWVLGGDDRNFWAARHLEAVGFSVSAYGVPNLPASSLPPVFRDVILPFPAFQGALLRGHSAVPVEELLCRTAQDTKVYGGLLTPWKQDIETRGGEVIDLYGSEPLTTANGVLTAEGAICLAIEHGSFSLHGANCLVIGYGRIGKVLAQKLQALSSHVTVSVRKAADQALAESFGLLTDKTGFYRHGLERFDFVFNTVPAQVLSPVQLAALPSHCLLIELASSPGGIDKEACEKRGLSYLPAPGLPGRFFPRPAGELYAESILELSQGVDQP
ncbi:MAG: hypothetical protein IJB35_02320 [Oscillospiraceae bacterium]|nr:hypothetical protein [Oscillospiraceae bacterium]